MEDVAPVGLYCNSETSPKILQKELLEEISFLPNRSHKFVARQIFGEESEILSSTPFKTQLEERKEISYKDKKLQMQRDS